MSNWNLKKEELLTLVARNYGPYEPALLVIIDKVTDYMEKHGNVPAFYNRMMVTTIFDKELSFTHSRHQPGWERAVTAIYHYYKI